MRKEIDIVHDVMIWASKLTHRLFRNNVGNFLTVDGRRIRTGLCVGSSDCIGWTRVKITQEMVGRQVAVFTAVEVKMEGENPDGHQQNFIEIVQQAGGIAGVARNEQDYDSIIAKIYYVEDTRDETSDPRF